MPATTIVFIVVITCWVVISYFYWRSVRANTGSDFTGFDIILLSGIMGLLISRIASVVVYRGLFGGGIQLTDFVNLSNPDFQYVLFPLISILAYQFFSFNFKLDRKWVEGVWGPIWFGAATTAVIILVQLVRVITAGWGANFVWYHLLQLLSLIVMVYIGYWGRRRRKYIVPGVLAVVCFMVGIGVSYLATGVFSTEENNIRLIILLVVSVAVLLPYLSRTVLDYGRADNQQSDGLSN